MFVYSLGFVKLHFMKIASGQVHHFSHAPIRNTIQRLALGYIQVLHYTKQFILRAFVLLIHRVGLDIVSNLDIATAASLCLCVPSSFCALLMAPLNNMIVYHYITEWFGKGSHRCSVLQHYFCVQGEKIFYLIKPTDENLALYESWSSSVTQSEVYFGEKVDKCYKCVVKQGHTLFVPTGECFSQ